MNRQRTIAEAKELAVWVFILSVLEFLGLTYVYL